MHTSTPSACKPRTMAAPTRRAPPVTSTARPARSTRGAPGSFMLDMLPPLTAAESEHSRKVVERVRDAIDAGSGWISFERFMEIALYEPGLGYYSAGAAKLGSGGDFVTAPEISPLFSRCVANQCREIL